MFASLPPSTSRPHLLCLLSTWAVRAYLRLPSPFSLALPVSPTQTPIPFFIRGRSCGPPVVLLFGPQTCWSTPSTRSESFPSYPDPQTRDWPLSPTPSRIDHRGRLFFLHFHLSLLPNFMLKLAVCGCMPSFLPKDTAKIGSTGYLQWPSLAEVD